VTGSAARNDDLATDREMRKRRSVERTGKRGGVAARIDPPIAFMRSG